MNGLFGVLSGLAGAMVDTGAVTLMTQTFPAFMSYSAFEPYIKSGTNLIDDKTI